MSTYQLCYIVQKVAIINMKIIPSRFILILLSKMDGNFSKNNYCPKEMILQSFITPDRINWLNFVSYCFRLRKLPKGARITNFTHTIGPTETSGKAIPINMSTGCSWPEFNNRFTMAWQFKYESDAKNVSIYSKMFWISKFGSGNLFYWKVKSLQCFVYQFKFEFYPK